MSGVLGDEAFAPEGAEYHDFGTLDGTACYCDPDSAAQLRAFIATRKLRALHWIDGGDYHYLSYFWLQKVGKPFVLVLYDNHPDDQPCAFGDDLLSCGSWVRDARRDCPLMQDVVWVRTPSEAADAVSRLPEGAAVYLSIDKDVLSHECYHTNWDQSEITLAELEASVLAVASGREVLGIDVCGGFTRQQGASDSDLELNLATDLELWRFLGEIIGK